MSKLKLFGIPVRFHPLFVLVLMTAAVTGYFMEIIILFAVVLIHEIGHAGAAKSFGWRVREIQLLPFGGAMVVDEHANIHPWETIAVSLAGPLQHVWMIAMSYVMTNAGLWDPAWGAYFMQVNMMIGLFNFIPVHPLDGGKIVQALLSLLLPYYRSLSITVWLGFASSTAILFYCLFISLQQKFPLNLFIIGVFLFFSNWSMRRNLPYHFLRFLIARAGRRQSSAHHRLTPIIVGSNDNIHHVLQRYKQQHEHVIYVTGPVGDIRAVLPEKILLEAYFNNRKTSRAVSDLFM